VASLAELADRYAFITTAEVQAAAFVKNALVVRLINGAATIAMEVRALMLVSRETADAEFSRFKELRAAGHSAGTAAQPQKAGAAKTAAQPVKHGANRPSSPGGPVHPVVIVKAGDTWESILRPFYDGRSGVSFQDFVHDEKSANRAANPDIPEQGPIILKPGKRVVIY
jgi:hypothetical protein